MPMESTNTLSSPLSDRSAPSQAGVLGVQVISRPGLWRSKPSIPRISDPNPLQSPPLCVSTADANSGVPQSDRLPHCGSRIPACAVLQHVCVRVRGGCAGPLRAAQETGLLLLAPRRQSHQETVKKRRSDSLTLCADFGEMKEDRLVQTIAKTPAKHHCRYQQPHHRLLVVGNLAVVAAWQAFIHGSNRE